MCPGGNPTDRRAFSLMPAAAMHDSRRALPAYTENQPKSAHHSPQRGVFGLPIFNYVVLTTEFGANLPNSHSRRFFPSVPVSSARSLTRVAVTQRHGCPADTLSASLADDRCFRLFDFQLRCFNNGIRRKFAEFPLAPTLGRCFNLKFRWKNNVIYFTKRKYTPYFRRRSLGQSRVNIYRHISQFPRTTQTAHRLRRCAPSGKRRSPTRRPCHRAGEPA